MFWRRRKSVVNIRQQVWFGLELVVVAIGFVILCAFLLFIFPLGNWFGGEVDPALLEQLMKLVFVKWPLIMLALGVLFVMGVLMSHRLAGPLFGLEKTISAWREGDRTSRVRFRKYDYLISVMKPLNDFFDDEQRKWADVEALAKDIPGEKGEKILSISKSNPPSE
jgi:hypothetical protein